MKPLQRAIGSRISNYPVVSVQRKELTQLTSEHQGAKKTKTHCKNLILFLTILLAVSEHFLLVFPQRAVFLLPLKFNLFSLMQLYSTFPPEGSRWQTWPEIPRGSSAWAFTRLAQFQQIRCIEWCQSRPWASRMLWCLCLDMPCSESDRSVRAKGFKLQGIWDQIFQCLFLLFKADAIGRSFYCGKSIYLISC